MNINAPVALMNQFKESVQGNILITVIIWFCRMVPNWFTQMNFNKWAAARQTIELHYFVWFPNTTSGNNMQIIYKNWDSTNQNVLHTR